MNAQEMHYNFGIKLSEYDIDVSINSDDKNYFLNEAQLSYIKNNFDPKDQRLEGFEQNQRIIDALKPLVIKNEEIQAQHVPNNGAIEKNMAFRAELPNDLMYIINYRSSVTYPEDKLDINPDGTIDSTIDTRTILSKTRYSQSDDIYKLLSDPFNKPRKLSPLVDISENYVDIYSDGSFIVEKVVINYLKQPTKIKFISHGDSGNTNCELPNFIHEDIIEIAVNLLLSSKSRFNKQKQDN